MRLSPAPIRTASKIVELIAAVVPGVIKAVVPEVIRATVPAVITALEPMVERMVEAKFGAKHLAVRAGWTAGQAYP